MTTLINRAVKATNAALDRSGEIKERFSALAEEMVDVRGRLEKLQAEFGSDSEYEQDFTNYILPGITREVVVELCAEAGYEVELASIPVEELYRADEVFIVGTTAEVTPITDLDGRAIGSGRPGAFALDLLERLRRRAQSA